MMIIDLRSDTLTKPTEAMRQAMASAEVGDDMFGEDPTVNRLENQAAERFGKEAAVFVASGVMGNLSSLMAHAQPGDEVILGTESHIYNYEAGSVASVAGLMPRLVREVKGQLRPADVAAVIRPPDQHFPTPRVLCLENTHNRGGGRITPLPLLRDLCAVARDHQLKIHLDGARLFNAEVATGTPVADFAAEVDSVSFCLSKGLSAPVGSVVVGDQSFIERVRRARKRLGGAMRQAGILAAAGLVALESMVDRLAEDHDHAQMIARTLARTDGLEVDLECVDSNMVFIDVRELGMGAETFARHLQGKGVLVIATSAEHVRLVLHRHIDTLAAREALRRIQDVTRECL